MDQIAVRGVDLDDVEAGVERARARRRRTRRRSSAMSADGRARAASDSSARTARRSGRPAASRRRSRRTAPPPSHGRAVLALRPACASWMPASVRCSWMKRTMRASPATCASSQMPRSCGLMRPSAVTAVASVNTSAAPPTARLPRWTKCQSFGEAVDARVLAHRRDDDAVGERQRAQRQRIEEVRHSPRLRRAHAAVERPDSSRWL